MATESAAATAAAQAPLPPPKRMSLTDPLGALFGRRASDGTWSRRGSDALSLQSSNGGDASVSNNFNESGSGWDLTNGSCGGGETTEEEDRGGGDAVTEASSPTCSSRPNVTRRASIKDMVSDIFVNNKQQGGADSAAALAQAAAATELAVQKVRDEKDAEIRDLRSESADLRAALNAASLRHQLELEEKNRQYRLMKTRLERMGRDMKDKDAIHEYCRMIKEAAPNRTDTQYVIRIQAQMAKVLHEMGVMGNQLTAMKQGCDGVVASLHTDMAKIVHDKSKAEQQFMNDLFEMEEGKRKLTEDYDDRLRRKDQEIEELKRKVMQLEIRNIGLSVLDDEEEVTANASSATQEEEEEKKKCLSDLDDEEEVTTNVSGGTQEEEKKA